MWKCTSILKWNSKNTKQRVVVNIFFQESERKYFLQTEQSEFEYVFCSCHDFFCLKIYRKKIWPPLSFLLLSKKSLQMFFVACVTDVTLNLGMSQAPGLYDQCSRKKKWALYAFLFFWPTLWVYHFSLFLGAGNENNKWLISVFILITSD